jgi:hypothetical protein
MTACSDWRMTKDAITLTPQANMNGSPVMLCLTSETVSYNVEYGLRYQPVGSFEAEILR